jgi:hypothetical protein
MRASRTSAAAVLAAGLLFSGSVKAADLNAPINTTPTLGSEIARGSSAAADCMITNYRPTLGTLCVRKLESQNRERMGNYEPFALGLNFTSWKFLDIWAFPRPGTPALEISEEARQMATPFFVAFRDYQRRLGVSDDQLISAEGTGANGNSIKARIEFWTRQPRP